MVNMLLKQEESMVLLKPTKTALAKRLGISRSMLYYSHKRPGIDEELKRQIETVLTKHKAYGHKRIAMELKMNKKRIRRVMKKFGMRPYRRRSKVPRKKEDEGKAPEDNSVNIYRLLCPISLNIVWVGDFTYIKFQGRFIYLSTIMDMFTREIIGVAVSRFHDRNLVLEAFMDAKRKSGTHPVYSHSDQGAEYTSDEYKLYIKETGIILSFADKASPWQNGFQESFYQGFKVDLGETSRFETLGELVEAIYQTIHYYNNERIHTALKMSPVAFKKAFLKSKDKLSDKLGT
jgi:putative transposase